MHPAADTAPDPGDAPRARANAPRRLARDGVVWTVGECEGTRVPGNADGARGSVCLVFASPEVVRRVWSVPANWRDLDDDALFALSWGR